MNEEKRNALLNATKKLKNAKKPKSSQEEMSNNSNKRAMNDEDDTSDDGLISGIINAVRRFKGD